MHVWEGRRDWLIFTSVRELFSTTPYEAHCKDMSITDQGKVGLGIAGAQGDGAPIARKQEM